MESRSLKEWNERYLKSLNQAHIKFVPLWHSKVTIMILHSIEDLWKREKVDMF